MPSTLVEFFVKFLTDEGDTVLDPFAGSNTTGAVAQSLERRWLSVEADWTYATHSIGRFDPEWVTATCNEMIVAELEAGEVDGEMNADAGIATISTARLPSAAE
jgi:site-specific DNA-methyltransferase (cytosine-N4-specific)